MRKKLISLFVSSVITILLIIAGVLSLEIKYGVPQWSMGAEILIYAGTSAIITIGILLQNTNNIRILCSCLFKTHSHIREIREIVKYIIDENVEVDLESNFTIIQSIGHAFREKAENDAHWIAKRQKDCQCPAESAALTKERGELELIFQSGKSIGLHCWNQISVLFQIVEKDLAAEAAELEYWDFSI